MAFTGNSIERLPMINVAIISNNASKELALLSAPGDINAIAIEPKNVATVDGQLVLFKPDIIVIEHSPAEGVSTDMLCFHLSKQFPKAHNIILSATHPTYEMLQNSGFQSRGYITPDKRDQIEKAIRVVIDGEAWLPRKLVTEMLNRLSLSFDEISDPFSILEK